MFQWLDFTWHRERMVADSLCKQHDTELVRRTGSWEFISSLVGMNTYFHAWSKKKTILCLNFQPLWECFHWPPAAPAEITIEQNLATWNGESCDLKKLKFLLPLDFKKWVIHWYFYIFWICNPCTPNFNVDTKILIEIALIFLNIFFINSTITVPYLYGPHTNVNHIKTWIYFSTTSGLQNRELLWT